MIADMKSLYCAKACPIVMDIGNLMFYDYPVASQVFRSCDD